MKYKICLILAICLINCGYAQLKYESGETFEFDTKSELDPHFVLGNNYNTYLLSVVNTDGMLANRKVIVRKFDQKNRLLETFKQDFPKFDMGTLHNYLGFTETPTGKAVVFTQSYSGKSKKSDIYMHEFDKATSKFTSTLINSSPIVSAGKSGMASLKKSENGRYIAIDYIMDNAKDEPEKSLILILDANTLAITWQKDVSFDNIPNRFFTKDFTVTNSGKVVLLRYAKGSKRSNYLVVVSKDGQEDKTVEPDTLLQEPKAVSIGTQDYLLAFNYAIKGVRGGDFGNLMLYDLEAGKTLQNNKVEGFNIRGIEDVLFRSITLQNNEIQIFTEGKVKVEMKPTIGNTGGTFSAPTFNGPTYKFGPAEVIVMGYDGKVKSVSPLAVDTNSDADLHHSFGLINIKGSYYLNTGNFGGFYPLNTASNYGKIVNEEINKHLSRYPDYNEQYLNQLLSYFPDSNRLLFVKVVGEKEMQLISIFGMKQ